jgi:hypothetical protein
VKIKDGFVMRRISDVHILAPAGEANIDLNGVITMNDSASFLFKQLQSEITKEALLSQLLDEYDVDAETAKEDIDAFCKQLGEANLIA